VRSYLERLSLLKNFKFKLMQPVAVNQAQDAIQEAIGLAVFQDRDMLIAMLRKNGASIDDDISDENLIKVTYLAIAKSNGFKRDFSDYLVGNFSEETLNYVDEEEFFNGDGDKKAARKLKKTKKADIRAEKGGSTVGKALGKVATPENINSLVNAGINVLSTKLTAKADQKSIQDATNLAAQKSQQALAEAKLAEQKAAGRKWIVPVAIVGVLLIGGVIYFVTRKKA